MRRRLVPVLLAVLLLSLAGCSTLDGGGQPTEKPSEGAQILERASESMQSVDTMRMRMVSDVEANGAGARSTAEMAIDRSAGLVRSEITVSSSMQTRQQTLYVDTDRNLTRKIDMDMEMSADGETVSMDMTMWARDFGADLDVQLPDAATDQATSLAG